MTANYEHKNLTLSVVQSIDVGQIPTFNYIPNKPMTTYEERENARIEGERRSSAKYYEKVKAYKKLGTLSSEKDKLKGLLLLCYPTLNQLNTIELDLLVNNIIASLPV